MSRHFSQLCNIQVNMSQKASPGFTLQTEQLPLQLCPNVPNTVNDQINGGTMAAV